MTLSASKEEWRPAKGRVPGGRRLPRTDRRAIMPDRDPIKVGYDAVYTAMRQSPTLRSLWREHAGGAGFPDEFAHISFVTIPQLQRVAALPILGADPVGDYRPLLRRRGLRSTSARKRQGGPSPRPRCMRRSLPPATRW